MSIMNCMAWFEWRDKNRGGRFRQKSCKKSLRGGRCVKISRNEQFFLIFQNLMHFSSQICEFMPLKI